MKKHSLLLALFSVVPGLAFAIDPNCPDLTTLQRAAGYVSWLGLVSVLGVGLLAGGICLVFWGVIKTVLEMTGLMETLLWIITVSLIGSSYFVDPSYQQWTLAVGAILIPCACLLTAHLHKIHIKEVKSLGVLTLVWGTIALIFGSSFVGFLAVGALLACLGFSVVVTPLCYSFGFTTEDAVPRATTSGLFIMAVYIGLRIFQVELGTFSVFEGGALWLATFVGFLGLLITSSSYYEDGEHALPMNILTCILFVAVISFGKIFEIKEVTTIAGAFLVFYVADKIIEIDTNGMIALGIKLFTAGSIVAGVWQWLRLNEGLVTQYLSL